MHYTTRVLIPVITLPQFLVANKLFIEKHSKGITHQTTTITSNSLSTTPLFNMAVASNVVGKY